MIGSSRPVVVVRCIRINERAMSCAGYLLCKTFMDAPFGLESRQSARRVLLEDVRLMAALTLCCSIEIYDPTWAMVLQLPFFACGSE